MQCVQCKSEVPDEYLEKIGSELVCKDCVAEYLSSKSSKFVDDFIAEHKTEYFLKWWFENLEDSEKVNMAEKMYAQYYSDAYWSKKDLLTNCAFVCKTKHFLTL